VFRWGECCRYGNREIMERPLARLALGELARLLVASIHNLQLVVLEDPSDLAAGMSSPGAGLIKPDVSLPVI
jgi:hypothetical protein